MPHQVNQKGEPLNVVDTEWVYCEYEATCHENEEDPFDYGPRYASMVDDLDAPRYHEGTPEQREKYGVTTDGDLLFYKCPGPHKNLYMLEADVYATK